MYPLLKFLDICSGRDGISCSLSLLDFLEDLRMKSLDLKYSCWMVALSILVLVPVALRAQVKAESVEKTTTNALPPRWDIFVGYS